MLEKRPLLQDESQDFTDALTTMQDQMESMTAL
jgi:hypothetical protein